MVFNSLTFIVFFACVLALHSLPLPWKSAAGTVSDFAHRPSMRPFSSGNSTNEGEVSTCSVSSSLPYRRALACGSAT